MTNTSNILSKSAQLVQNALSDKELSFGVRELSSSARTAKEAADALSCDVAQIVKSLIFRTDLTSQPILVLASGSNRVNEAAIEKLMGEKIAKADANFTRDVTGFAIGGIPPAGHKNRITHIFIDEDLMQYEKIWAAAGTPHAVFPLDPDGLIKLTEGKVVAIKL